MRRFLMWIRAQKVPCPILHGGFVATLRSLTCRLVPTDSITSAGPASGTARDSGSPARVMKACASSCGMVWRVRGSRRKQPCNARATTLIQHRQTSCSTVRGDDGIWHLAHALYGVNCSSADSGPVYTRANHSGFVTFVSGVMIASHYFWWIRNHLLWIRKDYESEIKRENFVSGILFWCKRTFRNTLTKSLVSRVGGFYGFIKTTVNAFMNPKTNVTNPG